MRLTSCTRSSQGERGTCCLIVIQASIDDRNSWTEAQHFMKLHNTKWPDRIHREKSERIVPLCKAFLDSHTNRFWICFVIQWSHLLSQGKKFDFTKANELRQPIDWAWIDLNRDWQLGIFTLSGCIWLRKNPSQGNWTVSERALTAASFKGDETTIKKYGPKPPKF